MRSRRTACARLTYRKESCCSRASERDSLAPVKSALRPDWPVVAASFSIASALGMLASTEARAAEPAVPAPPAHRISYDQLTGARLNPLGLEARYNLGVRSRLYPI